MRCVPLALGLLAIGCAAGRSAVRTGDGAGWREVRTAHFVVRTDADDTAALVRALESTYEQVSAVLAFPGRPAGRRAPTWAVAFRSRAELREFLPEETRAYTQLTVLGTAQVVFAFGEDGTPPSILAKEVARVQLLREIPGQPAWFALGAPASVAASAAVRLRAASAAGDVLEASHRRAREAGVRVRDLLSDGPLDRAAWGLAWPMADYLAEVHSRRLGEFLGRLATGEDATRAFSDVFPEWAPSTDTGPERLEAEIAAYVAARPRTPRVRGRAPDESATSRTLSSAEVLALRLGLPRDRSDPRAAERARIAEAEELLREVPSHPFAVATLTKLRHDDLLTAARGAVERHPSNAYAWALLADAFPIASPDRVAALRTALELAPDASLVANNLAWDLLKQGRHDEALWHANRAVALAPWNAAALDTQASILEELGYCREAVVSQRRAAEALRAQRSSQFAEYRDRAARMDTRCGGGGARGTAPPRAIP